VSSILQALKKIESELPGKSEIRFRQQEIDAQKIIHRDIRDKLRLNKQFFIIFAVIILAAGGGLVLGRKLWEKLPLPATKIKTEHTKPLSLIGKKTVDRNLSRKEKPVKRSDEKITAVKQAANKQSPSVIKPREKGQASVKKTKRKAEKSGQYSKSRRILSIPVKQTSESKLQLQAIAWSSDPKSRIAVINGRVLREGGSVERVLVTHIGKNEVIFKKGREEWKQLFRFE
jgi:hypothetical protein